MISLSKIENRIILIDSLIDKRLLYYFYLIILKH